MRLGIAKRHRFVELSPCVHRFLLAVQPPLNGVGRFLQSTLSLHPCLELQRSFSSPLLPPSWRPSSRPLWRPSWRPSCSTSSRLRSSHLRARTMAKRSHTRMRVVVSPVEVMMAHDMCSRPVRSLSSQGPSCWIPFQTTNTVAVITIVAKTTT